MLLRGILINLLKENRNWNYWKISMQEIIFSSLLCTVVVKQARHYYSGKFQKSTGQFSFLLRNRTMTLIWKIFQEQYSDTLTAAFSEHFTDGKQLFSISGIKLQMRKLFWSLMNFRLWRARIRLWKAFCSTQLTIAGRRKIFFWFSAVSVSALWRMR